jgi:hypothetical protein
MAALMAVTLYTLQLKDLVWRTVMLQWMLALSSPERSSTFRRRQEYEARTLYRLALF